MNLFRTGPFTLHSGRVSPWKIDCDALTGEDWDTLARVAALDVLPFFSIVEAVPGAEYFADAMRRYAQPQYDPNRGLLIVDDVLTTGGSMETQRLGRTATGLVVFARQRPAPWITALFTFNAQT